MWWKDIQADRYVIAITALCIASSADKQCGRAVKMPKLIESWWMLPVTEVNICCWQSVVGWLMIAVSCNIFVLFYSSDDPNNDISSLFVLLCPFDFWSLSLWYYCICFNIWCWLFKLGFRQMIVNWSTGTNWRFVNGECWSAAEYNVYLCCVVGSSSAWPTNQVHYCRVMWSD